MDLQSNVKALAKLYDLANEGGGGMSNLDEHARDLLKNMLDATSQRVLMSYSREMIEGQIQPLSLISPTPTLTPQAKTIVTATPERTSVVPCLPQYQKKRCKDCQKSYKKPVVSIQESNPIEMAEDLNGYTYFQQLQHNNRDEYPLMHRDEELKPFAFNKNCDYSGIEMQKRPPLSNLRGFTDFSSETENDSHYGSCISKEVEEHNMHTRGMNVDQQQIKRIIEKIDSGKWRTKYTNFVPTKIINQDKNQTSNKSKGRVMLTNSPQVIANGNVDFVKKHPSNGKDMTTVANNMFSKNGNYSTILRKSLPRHGSEEMTSSVSYSSYRSSDQNKSYGSDPEDYISGMNSEEYSSPSSEIESRYDISTSISEEEGYSSLDSDEYREPTPRIRRTSDGYSQYKHHTIPSRSKEVHSRIHKPANETSKKQSGMWKRMKDGLAVVFHHHHHHHHEHNGKSSSKREVKACEKKVVEKIKKSHGKKKQNNFHGIMEAVLSHVHRSKKNKMKKTVFQHGNKVVKKSVKRLWKVGARKNKPRLRALLR